MKPSPFQGLQFFVMSLMLLGVLVFAAGCNTDSTDTTEETSTESTVESETESTVDTEEAEETVSTESETEVSVQSSEDAATMEEALETLNLSTCNDIQNTLSRESCVTNVVMAQVKASGVTELCVNITDESAKEDCMALGNSEE